MKKILIAIHGLGNKPSRDLLSTWWLKAIHEGLSRIGKNRNKVRFEMVYWADVIYPNPMNPDIQDVKDPLYLNEPYNAGAFIVKEKKPTLKTKFFQYIEGQLDNVFLNDDLSINFSSVTDKVLNYYFSDLEKYYAKDCIALNNPKCSAKQEIRNRFYEVLRKYHRYEIFLISHSMGSIVAFDVLSEFADKLNINTFVTIGSPLGFPMIVNRIFSEQKMINHHIKRIHVPDCIRLYWHNLSDPGDKVAIDHTLADDFAENRKGIKAIDMLVTNDYEWNGEENPHKSYGYLRTAEMATIIDAFLTSKIRNKWFQIFPYYIKKIKSRIHQFKDVISGGNK